MGTPNAPRLPRYNDYRVITRLNCRLDMRKYSFSQRVINEWNKLPNDCVNTSSVNMFKNSVTAESHEDGKW